MDLALRSLLASIIDAMNAAKDNPVLRRELLKMADHVIKARQRLHACAVRGAA